MSRQDINYIIVHVFAFVAIYAGAMANTTSTSWFSWKALSEGLMGAGAASVGINVAGPKTNVVNEIGPKLEAKPEEKQAEIK